MKPLFEITLQRPARGSRDAARLILEQLRSAIVDGRLAPGTRLPPARFAREYFGVSRNTAAGVYERLRLEGLVSTRVGSGSYVAQRPRARRPLRRVRRDPAIDPRLNPFWLAPATRAALNFWPDDAPVRPPRETIDLRPALVDSRTFPLDLFRQASTRSLRSLENRPPRFKSPQGNQGHYPLRRQIANHLAMTRAVTCDPDAIVVTSGAQQAFDILARVLISPARRTVAIEDPGYPPLRVPFAAAGARIVPVPVDSQGVLVDALPPDAAVICVCPSHQFPLGSTLSPQRRRALLEFARQRGALIIEDDYDGEFRFDSQAIEPLRNEDTEELVIYVGTFSKCMLPSLRLGYLVAPPWMLEAIVAAKNATDWHCPTPLQMAAAAFIAGGHLARHVRRMRRIYEQRRRLVAGFIQNRMGASLELVPSAYGMHVAALAKESADCAQLAAQLATRGVRIHALDRYYVDRVSRNGLVFGFGVADIDALRAGLESAQEFLEAARGDHGSQSQTIHRIPR